MGDGLGGDACVDVNAEGAQLLRDQRGHLDFEGWQDVLGVLDEVGLEAAVREGFGGLDADEPGSEDDGSRARSLAQGEGVVDCAQGVHARGVEAVDWGPAYEGSRGEDEVVVGELVRVARLCVGDLDAVGTRGDRRNLGVDAHVEVEGRLEGLRGVEEELGGVFDLAADVVREPAVREGHVLAALQHDDLGALVAPAQARRRTHATGDSSNDYNSHVRLTFWLEDGSSLTVSMIPADIPNNVRSIQDIPRFQVQKVLGFHWKPRTQRVEMKKSTQIGENYMKPVPFAECPTRVVKEKASRFQSFRISTRHARRVMLISPPADTRVFSITWTRTRDPVCNESMSAS